MSLTEPAVRRALLACVRAAPTASDRQTIEALDGEGWRRLADEARRQRVSGLVQQGLHERGFAASVPAAAAAALAETARTAARATLILHRELAVVLARAAAANVPVLALKGAHLASAVYRNLALREMGDLDLLVPASRLEAAAALVQELGYAPYKPFDLETDRHLAQHLTTFIKRGAGAIEIHWTITEPGAAHSIDPAGLWDRAVPMTLLGQPARALSPADEILHLCAHASYNHLFGCGLRSLCDIMMVSADPGSAPAWDEIVRRADEWKWRRGAFLALRLARDLLDARVPEAVFDRLRPDGFDDRLAALAEDQLFADPAELRKLGAVSDLAGSQTLVERLRHVRDRVFLDPALLASLYGRPATISRAERLWWYSVRASGLLRRASPTVLRLWRERDTPFVSVARGQSRLRGWLAEAGR
jgi:hypothetical protein